MAAETTHVSNGSSNGRHLPLHQLQPNITCAICRGYLIDATTITECMHTFCKSCLLQRLENIPSCPTCGIQLQRSKLSEQLRLDHAIQLLVYTAVPGLWQEEQRRRQYFSDNHPLTTTVAPVLHQPTCFSPTDPISLSLDFISTSRDEEVTNHCQHRSSQIKERRYFRCPAAVTVHHFQKLLTLKFELNSDYLIEIFYSNDKLEPSLRLMDVAYKYSWSQEEPLRLEYKIIRSSNHKMVVAAPAANSSTNSSSSSSNNSTNQSCPGIKSGRKTNQANGRLRSGRRQLAPKKPVMQIEAEEKIPVEQVNVPVSNRLNDIEYKAQCRSHISQLSVYRTMHQVLKKKLPVLLSSKSKTTHHKKKKGKTKYHKRKASDTTVENHAKKVKFVQIDKKKTVQQKNDSTTNGGDHWPRPNGVELLVKAAELASQQISQTPPPPTLEPTDNCSTVTTTTITTTTTTTTTTPSDDTRPKTDEPCTTTAVTDSDIVHNNNNNNNNNVDDDNSNDNSSRERDGQENSPVAGEDNNSEAVMANGQNESDPSENWSKTDESPLIIVEDESQTADLTINEEKMEEDDKKEETCPVKLTDNDSQHCDHGVALDLSSKSSRTSTLEENGSSQAGWNRPNKAISPNLQRSALHSITDSLAQRQQRLMTLQQPKTAVQHNTINVCSSSDAMRNLLTLSQTAALVASRTTLQPSNPERVAAQRLLVAMQRTFASFSAAAAAAAPTLTAAPLCIPRSETGSNSAKPQSKSFSYNFIRHPF